jgi:hypothetical protein
MERTMRFVTEQRWHSGRGPSDTGSQADASLDITYRFTVTAVDAAGIARVESMILDARAAPPNPGTDPIVRALVAERRVVSIDRQGRLLGIESGQPRGTMTPALPGSLAPLATEGGDFQGMFGGLNGRTVSPGETWTTELPRSGETGLRGSIHWTLVSLAGTTARLEYTGRVSQPRMELPGLPPGMHAALSGDVSGYVALERDTGWPVQGRSIMRIEMTMESGEDGLGSRLLSLSLSSRFETGR